MPSININVCFVFSDLAIFCPNSLKSLWKYIANLHTMIDIIKQSSNYFVRLLLISPRGPKSFMVCFSLPISKIIYNVGVLLNWHAHAYVHIKHEVHRVSSTFIGCLLKWISAWGLTLYSILIQSLYGSREYTDVISLCRPTYISYCTCLLFPRARTCCQSALSLPRFVCRSPDIYKRRTLLQHFYIYFYNWRFAPHPKIFH